MRTRAASWRLSPLGAFLASAAVSAAAGAGDADGDFTSWSPPERRPEFRELVKGEEYERQSREALAGIDMAALEASKAPVAGLEITEVDGGSQAERLGLEAGDVIVEINGSGLAYKWQFGEMRKGPTQTLVVRRTDGSTKSVEVREGRIGIWYRVRWTPELEHVRGAKRSPKWDDEVMVALTRFDKDPSLAETALRHAVAKGYEPDALTDEIGAHVAASRGRYEEAMAFAWLALEADSDRLHAANLLSEIALASFKLDVGLGVLKRYPQLAFGDLGAVRTLLADFRLHVHGREKLLRATELADDRARKDVLAAAKPLGPSSEYFVPFLQGGDALLSPPKGMTIPVVFGPAAADVEMIVSFSLEGNGDEKLPNRFSAGWLDETHRHFPSCKTCDRIHHGFGVEVHEYKGVKIHHYVPEMKTTRIYHDVNVGMEMENRLRLVVCDRQCEVVLNGLRLYHAPWPGEVRRLVPCLKVVGVRVRIHELSVTEIVDAPAPAPEREGADEVF